MIRGTFSGRYMELWGPQKRVDITPGKPIDFLPFPEKIRLRELKMGYIRGYLDVPGRKLGSMVGINRF